MKLGNKNIGEQAFKRYLANEMSPNERNAFEKEVLKNSFEDEALEGFESTGITNFRDDIKEIKKRLKSGKRKNSTAYIAAAASIILLLASTFVWVTLQNNTPISEISENTEIKPSVLNEAEDNNQPKSLSNSQVEDSSITFQELELTADEQILQIADVSDELEIIQDSDLEIEESTPKEIKSPNKENQEIFARRIPQPTIKVEEKRNNNTQKKLRKDNTYSAGNSKKGKIVKGEVISADDQTPVAGAIVVEKGTSNGTITDINGEFELQLKKDSNTTIIASFIGMEEKEHQVTQEKQTIELQEDNVALSEVVVVGYGRQKKNNLTAATSELTPTNRAAQPVCGMKEYKNILANKAKLPINHPSKKIVVKLLLHIDENGEIKKIKNTNNADKVMVEKAIKIIKEAPDWNPKFENGEKVTSKSKVKLIFRKY